MQPNEPESRHGLFLTPVEGSALDPQAIPFTMTTPPYHPRGLASHHHPHAKPYVPVELPPVQASADELAAARIGMFPVLRARLRMLWTRSRAG